MYISVHSTSLPSNGEPETSTSDVDVIVGKVVSAVGVRGEVKVEVLSDVPQRYAVGATLYINGRSFQIEKRRVALGGVVVKFAGVDSRNMAEELRGSFLSIPEAEVPPVPEGTYYHYQLLGAQVVSADGKEIGEVVEIMETGANDVYVVVGAEGEILVPAIDEVVRVVDVEGKRIVVDLPGEL